MAAPVVVIVDSKEKSAGKKRGGKQIYEHLLSFEEQGLIAVVVDHLGDSTDYAIPTKDDKWHLIQRKKAAELTHPGTLFEDIIGMSKVKNAEPYVLLEGSLASIRRYSRKNIDSLIGSVETVLLPQEYGGFNCKIIPSPGHFWTACWLKRRALRVGASQPKKGPQALRSSASRKWSLDKQQRYLVEGFPGIGPQGASAILTHFGSVKAFIENAEEVDQVPGIGKKLKAGILAVLYHKYGS